MRLPLSLLVFVSGLTFLSSPVRAQSIPQPLQEWKEWAAEPYAYRSCALAPAAIGQERSDYLCIWPGQLDLRIDEKDGSFTQSWVLETDADVVLPGSRAAWPQQVRVDNATVPVVDKRGLPVVRLSKGGHTISGVWQWDEKPSQLEIPAQSAWWKVSGVPSSRRLENRLLFQSTEVVEETVKTKDVLGVRVFRKMMDGQVPQQDIQILITSGGNAREVVLGPVVDPAQWLPVSMDSAWPVRWQDDGKIRVQVQAGSNTVSLRVRCQVNCSPSFTRPKADNAWPALEYWALESDPSFRVVAWEGQSIDPEQAGAPKEWHHLPWVAVPASASQSWSIKSRGPSDKDLPLTLNRTAWLDFSGKGWWVVDHVEGSTPKNGRLNALAPYKMHSATGLGETHLVAEHKGKTGVEVRSPVILMNAVLRQEGKTPRVPIVGVEGEFSQVQWHLNMPAGYRVLFAPGADTADNVWWNTWRLTQVLGVALILILSWRWGRWRATLPSAGLILLAFHTQGMPIWSWGFALGAALLAFAGLPERLRKVASFFRIVFLGLWLLLATSFAIFQVRAALYPDWVQPARQSTSAMFAGAPILEGQSGSMEEGVYDSIGEAGSSDPRQRSSDDTILPVLSVPAPAAAPLEGHKTLIEEAASEMAVDSFSSPSAAPPPPAILNNTGLSISAGPGLPDWNEAHPVLLSWQGPITPADTVQLWVAGPFLVRLGRWISVFLLVLVGWSLLRRPPNKASSFPRWLKLSKRVAVSLVLCVPLPLFAVSPPQEPTTPEQSVMERVARSVYPVPPCAPGCTSIEYARVRGQGSELVIELSAHAQARSALILPSDPEQSLVLTGVFVGNQAQPAVMSSGSQTFLLLDKGVSQVRLVFSARTASGALRFEQLPGRITVERAGWTFAGISRNTLESGVMGWQNVSGSVKPEGQDAPRVHMQVPPFVRISRVLVLGAKWEIQTRVERVAPMEGAFVVPVALVEGEQPRQDLPRNDKSEVEVSFSPGQTEVSWQSDIKPRSPLKLTASSSNGVDTWRIQAGTRFHVEASGLPSRADSSTTFQPLPGEALTLVISEPKPVKGVPVAVDRASLSQQWGPRGQTLSMELEIRTTTPSDLMLDVPDGLDLVSVKKGDVQVAGVKVENKRLMLPVGPGTQSWSLEWRSSDAPKMWVGSEPFAIHAPVANLSVMHTPGDNRWILATPGPGKSPAVAYWPWLLVLIVLATLVGRWKGSPLSTSAWILLGIGFSVAAPWKIALVGGWLIAVRARSTYSDDLHASRVFNLYQVGFVIWTLVAIGTLVSALPESLLATPDMRIFGETGGTLTWFVDQVAAGQAWASSYVFSFPMWVYRVLMLGWCLWLALNAVNWLKNALRAWLEGGYWHGKKGNLSSIRSPEER